jgi:hypothetical protein
VDGCQRSSHTPFRPGPVHDHACGQPSSDGGSVRRAALLAHVLVRLGYVLGSRTSVKAVILIPYRDGGNDRRAQLWDWTRWFLAKLNWPIVVGDGDGETFSRSAAINDAAKRAGAWDLALIGDADTVQDEDAARRGMARAAEVGMAIPWSHRWKLSAHGTDKLVRRGMGAVTHSDRDLRDRTSFDGGGATVCVSREAFDAVGGFDTRFASYGNEDHGFRASIETLCIGNGSPREHGLVFHMWHQPVKFVGQRMAATPENRILWDRYKAARWKPEQMRALLKERW